LSLNFTSHYKDCESTKNYFKYDFLINYYIKVNNLIMHDNPKLYNNIKNIVYEI